MPTSPPISRYLRTFYLLVMISYVPPFLWYLLTGQGVYQHGYHILLVLLASGVATGAEVRSTRLAFFLFASMGLNLIIFFFDSIGLRFPMAISLAALALLVLCLMVYYGLWGWLLVTRFRNKP